ncbi:SRPBCC family protein [Streptomyces griseus]|uniref:SRPBCC family protein n=1 Tax=Streptomyces griseus TaxID=1911 RepID=UPI0005626C7C|nr:SRPBCC family protein [Streptomyces griseus]
MSDFREAVDIDRTPEDVWAYIMDPEHLPEWQESAVAVEQLDEGPVHVGSRLRITRHVGRRDMPFLMEYTECDPPHAWGLRALEGPVRPRVHGEITPLDDGRRSRVTMEIELEGHGVGKVLVPLVVRPQVRKELPYDEQLLKQHLERTTA